MSGTPTVQTAIRIPMPSFPAPALGAALFVQPAQWMSLRGGLYDGAPRSGSFAGSA